MKYSIGEYVLLSYKYDDMIVKIYEFKYRHYLEQKNICSKYYSVIPSTGCIISYVCEYDLLRRATDDEIKQFNDDFTENFYRKHYEKKEKEND